VTLVLHVLDKCIIASHSLVNVNLMNLGPKKEFVLTAMMHYSLPLLNLRQGELLIYIIFRDLWGEQQFSLSMNLLPLIKMVNVFHIFC